MENTEGYIEEREGDLEYDRMMEYEQGQEGDHEHDPHGEHGGAADNGLDQMTGTFNNVAQGLSGHYRSIMLAYWQEIISSIEHDEHEFKVHQLPLARIKKVMKADEDVKMISAEAPILFAKGCDIFITELSMRAWIHAEEHKRRTLQRSDIASALQRSDMFDFLIDIVPREEATLPPAHEVVRPSRPLLPLLLLLPCTWATKRRSTCRSPWRRDIRWRAEFPV